MLFANQIKKLREENNLLQRQLASALEIDTPMYSKIERGDRLANREQVVIIAKFLSTDENEVLSLWLADKVLDVMDGEKELGGKVLEIANANLK